MKKISFLSIISTLIITSCVSPNPPKLVVVLISDQADPNILDNLAPAVSKEISDLHLDIEKLSDLFHPFFFNNIQI